MTDSVCQLYLYYMIDDTPYLYGWSTKKKIAENFEKSRNMPLYEKKIKPIYVHELEDFFYEYGDQFIDVYSLMNYGYKVKIALTKREWITLQNTMNRMHIDIQDRIAKLNKAMLSDKLRECLKLIDMQNDSFTTYMNIPSDQSPIADDELSIFIALFDEYIDGDFINDLKAIKKDEVPYEDKDSVFKFSSDMG